MTMHSITSGKPAILIFDLGGVLVDFVGGEAMRDLLDGRYSLEEVKRRWVVSPALQAFERGAMAPDVFAKAMVSEWALPLTPDDFLSRFETWPRAFYDGAETLLAGLRRTHRLACLSNTNRSHWDRMGAMADFEAWFDDCFASFRMTLCKPDPAIFAAVAEALNVPPDRIVFFDDAPVNVAAARAAGWQAVQALGLEGVRAGLTELGLDGAAER